MQEFYMMFWTHPARSDGPKGWMGIERERESERVESLRANSTYWDTVMHGQTISLYHNSVARVLQAGIETQLTLR